MTQVPSVPTSARATLKSVLGQKLVEVVAGDAAGNVRELGADRVGVLVANGREAWRRSRPGGPPCWMIDASSASLVAPTVICVPSSRRMRSSSTLSTVLPPSRECVPQELLPIIPPMVQRLCVEGSGAKVS